MATAGAVGRRPASGESAIQWSPRLDPTRGDALPSTALTSAPSAADAVLTDAAAVEALASRVRSAGRMALDTEFLWERTYAPQLCLVQVAVGSDVALVDPIAGAPLEPVAALLADPAVEVVMHAPAGDLLAFGLHHDVRPTRIVDTQTLAGFVGLTASASLERLIAGALRITLGHHESFSDWSRRPLSATQAAYAGDDVRHLEALADRLWELADGKGRRAWAEAELERRFGASSSVVPDPSAAWRKVARRGRLTGRQLAVLGAVAAWREREARRRDLPASWVMKDPTLVELARTAPRTPEAAQRLRGFPKTLPAGELRSLLDAIADGLEAPLPPQGRVPAPAVQRRVEAAAGLAGTLLKVRCADADLAPELVATRSDLDRFVEAVVVDDAVDEQPLGTDWRWDLVGREIVELVEGRVSLSLRTRPPYLRIAPFDGGPPVDG